MPKHETKKAFCCISSNSRAETRRVDKILLEVKFNARIMQKSGVVTSARSLFIF